MRRNEWNEILDRATEALAVVEHDRWAHWQRYLHSKGTLRKDGSLVLPATLVAQWQRQITTGYRDLSDQEKDSDREQVREYLRVLEAILVRDD